VAIHLSKSLPDSHRIIGVLFLIGMKAFWLPPRPERLGSLALSYPLGICGVFFLAGKRPARDTVYSYQCRRIRNRDCNFTRWTNVVCTLLRCSERIVQKWPILYVRLWRVVVGRITTLAYFLLSRTKFRMVLQWMGFPFFFKWAFYLSTEGTHSLISILTQGAIRSLLLLTCIEIKLCQRCKNISRSKIRNKRIKIKQKFIK